MRMKTLLGAGTLAGLCAIGAASPALACALSGNYSTKFAGFVGRRPLAAAALLTASNGSFSGVLSVSTNGFIQRDLSLTGTFTVNANCTGSGTISNGKIGNVHFDFVLSGGGTGFTGVETDGGTEIAISAKQ